MRFKILTAVSGSLFGYIAVRWLQNFQTQQFPPPFLYKTTQYHILEDCKVAIVLPVLCGCITSLWVLENRILRRKVGLRGNEIKEKCLSFIVFGIA